MPVSDVLTPAALKYQGTRTSDYRPASSTRDTSHCKYCPLCYFFSFLILLNIGFTISQWNLFYSKVQQSHCYTCVLLHKQTTPWGTEPIMNQHHQATRNGARCLQELNTLQVKFFEHVSLITVVPFYTPCEPSEKQTNLEVHPSNNWR